MYIEEGTFRNAYRIASARLPGWDYMGSGYYYITICTKDRFCYFGDIQDKKMLLSECGKIAEQFWKDIPLHFPHAALDEFVVMPNHVHGIIIIDHGGVELGEECKICNQCRCRDGAHHQHRRDEACLVSTTMTNDKSISPRPNSLSAIIGSFKSAVTKAINKQLHLPFFAWQPRFHDHVIRNEKSLNAIREYIRTNPENWEKDDLFPHIK